MWLRLFGTGPQGSGALSQERYASERLISGLQQLQQWDKGGKRALPVVSELSRRTGDAVGLPRSIIYKNPGTLQFLLLRQLSRFTTTSAMLQSSISVSSVAAAADAGTVPTLAEARVEVRLLPDEDPNAFLGDLRVVLSKEGIDVEVLQMDPPAVEASFQSPFFQAIEGAARQVFPEKVVAPIIFAGDTPASAFAYAGLPVLRLPAPSEDSASEETTTTVELRDATELLFQTLYGASYLEDPFNNLIARRY
jgi:acetylornithine deacetylase/succinyl-diaminopimelate desuccinylase-like protein